MRTKTILTAAAGMLCAASAMAVTSVNVVGYVNVPLQPGFNLLCAPLQAANNNISSILPSAPDFCSVQKWNATLQQFDDPTTFLGVGVGWDVDIAINPGEGYFINVGEVGTLTFVGDVRQSGAGTLNTPLVAGFSFVGSQVPQVGGIQSVLGFAPSETEFDTIQQWDSAIQQYKDPFTYLGGNTWDPQEPSLFIGEAVIINRASPGSWARNFNVQ